MSELQDLTALIRANTPLIVIQTQDESRVVELFRQALMHVWRALYRWSITEGLRRIDMDREDEAFGPPDASSVLRMIQEAEQRGIYLLLDFHPYLGYASHQRLLRDIVQRRHSQPHVLVLVGAKVELPPELEALATRFNPRLPDANALLKMLREEAASYARDNGGRRVEADQDAVQQILRNLRGLSMTDARRIARQLIYEDGALQADDLPQLAKLKFELLNRSGNLHYEYDSARFNEVAGARRLKRWIEQRRAVFVSGNAPPGLDPPKGMLLLGVQGCGKSMLAKATAAGFGVPLLRLDFGTLYNKYHGETEKNLREALTSAEQLAPCVLWIDEIEKGLASNGEDGGVSRRVLGYLLTWLAERKAPVFIVATANQVHELPAELLRKGRFDEIFFVDLPAPDVRVELLQLHLQRRQLDPEAFALPALAAASEGFSGAEIEQAVVAGLYAAHAEQRPLDTELLMAEIRNTRPLSVLMAEQVQSLRDWARERTVPAD
ncbi:AAA family ATPase [Stenotrophomonas sp. ATCM1_4]|jgi:SpoVK/Ycf46/Vps4 family AAA+-type ATPase|uniref:AAA family ATPase n=1 Tax=unclassified Stenotrophomonas TaxID=196198 RepID=UPI00104BB2A2|nr:MULTISPECIES: AAA family ATPase [unclassified Stenotrophomonas]MBD9537502.1 AAA family ATPase [Stenotrophomonas sp. STM01]TDB26279.1 AAA family ATPase [Stenotrophomonas sp. ATCM1_4]